MSADSESKRSKTNLAVKSNSTVIPKDGTWEIPRKTLHYSIGFLVLSLYAMGYDPANINPILLYLFLFVLSNEFLRFSIDAYNRLYCRVVGPLMRKREEKDRINGVVYYLAGCIVVLHFFTKDIASLSIVYLSWADPTASVFGRLFGRYTPRFGNKTLAGTSGAVIVGGLVTFFFFRLLSSNEDLNRGGWPLISLSIYGGLTAGASEAVSDYFGIDDNFVIPVVSACLLQLWFLVFV